MTLNVTERDHGLIDGRPKIVQAFIRTRKPPFNPDEIVREFSDLLKTYRVSAVSGDRYSGEWCVQAFSKQGITYKNSERNKSEIYGEFLPVVMQGRVEVLDNKKQAAEFRQLERRTGRGGGKDSIDHPPGLHDDAANACAGAAVAASIRPPGPMKGRVYTAAASGLGPTLGRLNRRASGRTGSLNRNFGKCNVLVQEEMSSPAKSTVRFCVRLSPEKGGKDRTKR